MSNTVPHDTNRTTEKSDFQNAPFRTNSVTAVIKRLYYRLCMYPRTVRLTIRISVSAYWRGILLTSISLGTKAQESGVLCNLTAGENHGDQFETIRTYFTEPNSDIPWSPFALNRPPLNYAQIVRFVVDLTDPSRTKYSSILPEKCDLFVEDKSSGSQTIVRIMKDSQIVKETGLVINTGHHLDNQGYLTTFYMDINSTIINSAEQQMELSVNCEIRLCIDAPADRSKCTTDAANFGAPFRKPPVYRTFSAKTVIGMEHMRGKREAGQEQAVEIDNLYCVNEALFISLVTGLGALLLLLISADGYYALKAFSSDSSNSAERTTREMPMVNVVSRNVPPSQGERMQRQRAADYPRSGVVRAEMVPPRRQRSSQNIPDRSDDRFYY